VSKSQSPLVQSVVRGLSKQIDEGILGEGKRLPSERELGVQFHVSRAIIRNAIQILEDQGLIVCRVNCRPVVAHRKRSRQELAAPSYRYLGIWMWPNPADFGAQLMVKGIQRAVKDPDLRIVISNAVGEDWMHREESEGHFLRRMANDPHAVGAIVYLIGGENNLDALRALREADIPLVFVDRLPPSHFEADYVGTDNVGAMRQAVKHLIDFGHRRIAFVTNDDGASSVAERIEGYRQALDSAGIPFDPANIVYFHVDVFDMDGESSLPLIDRLEAMPDRPTAVVCVNDVIGFSFIQAARRRGYRIPEDMSVVGFDGLSRFIPGGGGLTSPTQSFERIGEQAAELVLQRIKQGTPQSYRHIILDAPLVDWGSTGRASISPKR